MAEKKERECHRVFEFHGDKVGVCVGVTLNPSGHPKDFVNLCLTEIVEEKGEKISREVASRCMTLDEASQLALHLMECRYVFNQLKGDKNG